LFCLVWLSLNLLENTLAFVLSLSEKSINHSIFFDLVLSCALINKGLLIHAQEKTYTTLFVLLAWEKSDTFELFSKLTLKKKLFLMFFLIIATVRLYDGFSQCLNAIVLLQFI
jgi:hypothetical protein